MAFEVKEWTDRQVQYPGRRKLMPTIIENVYDIERAEGTVSEPGNAFDAANMNDLEARIKAAFESIRDTDIFVVDKNNHFTAEKLDGVLDELFMFASNGKKLIAEAVGGSASSSFRDLANIINNGKKSIANAVGQTKAGSLKGTENFSQIADFISKNKCSFSVDGSQYLVGEAFPGNNKLWERRINFNFGFTPNRIATDGPNISFKSGASFNANFGSNVSDPGGTVQTGAYRIGVKDLTSNGFTIWYKEGDPDPVSNMSLKSGTIYFTAYRVP